MAASKASVFEREGDGVWQFLRWSTPHVLAGITDRQTDLAHVLRRVGHSLIRIEAEQVHGGTLAAIGPQHSPHMMIAGCDALLSDVTSHALCIRTADCIPLFLADPLRGVVGLVHAGWRGLAAQLPLRTIAAFRHLFHSQPHTLDVAVGPAIRACCYEVGPEFTARFGRFVSPQSGRLMCDLVGIAKEQLHRAGVLPERIMDSQRCTACEPGLWHSVRRGATVSERLTSFIMLSP